MTSKNTDGLKAAAQAKAETTRIKVEKAIRQMRKNNELINISSVATAAGVSRTYLQQHPDFRNRIRLLGDPHLTQVPPAQTPTSTDNTVISALKFQLQGERKANEQKVAGLTHEIKRLEHALAQLHGELLRSR